MRHTRDIQTELYPQWYMDGEIQAVYKRDIQTQTNRCYADTLTNKQYIWRRYKGDIQMERKRQLNI